MITALLFQDYFGGEIYKIKMGDVCHCVNVLNNEIYNIKSHQVNVSISYDNGKIKQREVILSNRNILKKYCILKEKYEQECAKL